MTDPTPSEPLETLVDEQVTRGRADDFVIPEAPSTHCRVEGGDRGDMRRADMPWVRSVRE
jgi:hypothetical protein